MANDQEPRRNSPRLTFVLLCAVVSCASTAAAEVSDTLITIKAEKRAVKSIPDPATGNPEGKDPGSAPATDSNPAPQSTQETPSADSNVIAEEATMIESLPETRIEDLQTEVSAVAAPAKQIEAVQPTGKKQKSKPKTSKTKAPIDSSDSTLATAKVIQEKASAELANLAPESAGASMSADEVALPPVAAEPSGIDQIPAPETASQAAPASEPSSEPSLASDTEPADGSVPEADVEPAEKDDSLHILGTSIGPGETQRLHWIASESLYGSKLEAPVYVLRGEKPGLTLCLTAAIHGDELNGVEIVRQVVTSLDPKKLSGTVIGVPIVNLLGFTRGTRYLPDRRDLNRYFPGNPNGSSASRIAYSFFEEIVRHCDRLIDLHTGSLSRTNMPQIRGNLSIPEVLEFTTKFGSTAVLHSRKLRGNLRTAATDRGIPAVAMELGEPGSLQKKHIEDGVEIIENVLGGLKMSPRSWIMGEPQPVFYNSRWVRVNSGGLLIADVKVGDRIKKGTLLGTMVNPISNDSFEVRSPFAGKVLGMALNQFMLPGYAAFNIGIVADEEAAIVDAQTYECTNTAMDPEQVSDEFGCSSGEDEEIERMESDLGEAEGEEGS